jgi:hypothetical protein
LEGVRQKQWLLRTVAGRRPWAARLWTGSWASAPDNPSVVSASGAIIRVICAGSVRMARGRNSYERQASGSNRVTGSQFSGAQIAPLPVMERVSQLCAGSATAWPVRRGSCGRGVIICSLRGRWGRSGAEPAQPVQQIGVPGRGSRELPDAKQPADRIERGGDMRTGVGVHAAGDGRASSTMVTAIPSQVEGWHAPPLARRTCESRPLVQAGQIRSAPLAGAI